MAWKIAIHLMLLKQERNIRILILAGADLAQNLTVAGSAKRDLRRGGEREARVTRGSGGGAPGKFFGAMPFTSWETPYLAVVY